MLIQNAQVCVVVTAAAVAVACGHQPTLAELKAERDWCRAEFNGRELKSLPANSTLGSIEIVTGKATDETLNKTYWPVLWEQWTSTDHIGRYASWIQIREVEPGRLITFTFIPDWNERFHNYVDWLIVGIQEGARYPHASDPKCFDWLNDSDWRVTGGKWYEVARDRKRGLLLRLLGVF